MTRRTELAAIILSISMATVPALIGAAFALLAVGHITAFIVTAVAGLVLAAPTYAGLWLWFRRIGNVQ